MVSIVKRYPTAAFFCLTYIFLILGWVLFQAQISLGPLLAALIVTPIIGGRQGLRAWASRIVRWRVGVQWYAAAILLPLIATGVGALLAVLLGAAAAPIQVSVPDLIPEAIFVFLIVGLGEEPGFRGFVLPQLQARYPAVVSTLILAALGIIWHIPLILSGDSPPVIVAVILVGYMLFTWLFNNSGGSILIAMLFHTAQAIFGPQVFATMFSGDDLIHYTWLMVLVYAGMAGVIFATSRNRYLLARPSDQTPIIAGSSLEIATN